MRHSSKFAIIRRLLLSMALIAVAFAFQPAHAYDSDESLENYGHLCTRQVVRQERENGIPSRLLRAIAATETGRWHSRLKMLVPWPWAINVEGKPYFFNTKHEAVAAVAAFQAKGITSIDVGCMQVNLHHHPDAFANIQQALEPQFNVGYAAKLLRSHYNASGSWQTAVGRYHSFTPKFANPYISRVYSKWHGFAQGGGTQVACLRDPHRVTPSGNRAQQEKKRYTTFIQVGNNEPTYFSHASDKRKQETSTQAVVRKPSTQPQQATSGGNRYQLALIKPTFAANKIETAPSPGDELESPLVISDISADKKAGKGFSVQVTSPTRAAQPQQETEPLFIRFSN